MSKRLMPPLTPAEQIVRSRLDEGSDRVVTVQINLTFTQAEADRLARLADDLDWSKRKVVATGLQTLEATLKELEADALVSNGVGEGRPT